MIQITCLILLLLISTGIGNAAEMNSGISTSWNYSSDSDGLTVHKVTLGALTDYTSAMKSQGIELQGQAYHQSNDTITGKGINYAWHSIETMTGMGSTLRAGLNQQGTSKTIMTLDWNFNKNQNEYLSWGLTANSDWVESIAALQNGTYYSLIGGNLDFQIHPRFTLVGAVNLTHFSDMHDRQQQRLRAIWDAWPEQGFTLQWAYKHQNGESLTTPTYFNPDRLDESIGIIGWRKRFNGWQAYTRLGAGKQTINSESTSPVRMLELQITSPPKDNSFFKLRLGHNETYGINGPGYIYRFFELQYILPLGR